MEKKLIYNKISTIMNEMGSIGREKYNEIQRFYFRGIDQFVNTLHPELSKNRVFLNPITKHINYTNRDVVRKDGKTGIDTHCTVLVEYQFICSEDNSSMVVGPFPGEGIDSSDKATYKAMTGALKNMLIEVFMVPTEDMNDPDDDHIESLRTTSTTSLKKTEKPLVIPTDNDKISGITNQNTKPVVTPKDLKETVSDEIKKELWASVKALGFDDEGAKKWFILVTNKQHSKEWTDKDVSLVRKKIQEVMNNNPQVLTRETDQMFV